MTNILKRMGAFTLALCLMLPMVAPLVSASDPAPATAAPVVYDFNYTSAANEAPVYSGQHFTDLNTAYDANESNWAPLLSFYGGGKAPEYSTANQGIFFNARQVGSWFSFKIKAPAAGDYTVNIDYWNGTMGASQAEVYLIPANAITGTVDNAALEAAMAAGTGKLIKSVNFYTGPGSDNLGKFTVEEGISEYYLVIKAYAARSGNTDPNVTGGHNISTNMTLKKITFSEYVCPYTEGVYDFNADFAHDSAVYSGTNYTNANISYTYEEMNWAPFLCFYGGGDAPKYRNEDPAKQGIFFNARKVGSWFSFKIKAPAAGDYTVNIDYWKETMGASQADVYLIPSTAITGTVDNAALEAAMAAGTGKLIKSVNFYTGLGSDSLGKFTVEEGVSEYYLVIKAYAARNGNTDPNKTNADANHSTSTNMSLKKITFSEYVCAYTEGIYDFNADFAHESAVYSGANYTNANASYTHEEMNWAPLFYVGDAGKAPQYHNEGTFKGIWFDARKVGSWFSFKLQTPAADDYVITLDYDKMTMGASRADVYLIPSTAITGTVDSAALEAAMAAGTGKLAKNVNFYSGSGSINLGRFTVEEGVSEYYLVIKAVAARNGNTDPNKTNADANHSASTNMNLKKITLTKYVYQAPTYENGVYDFAYNAPHETPVFTDTAGVNAYTNISNAYDNNASSWMPYLYEAPKAPVFYNTSKPNAENATGDFNGIFVNNGKVGSWVAFKIKSPGAGEYTATLDFNLIAYTYASQADFYIIPSTAFTGEATKDDLVAAMNANTGKLKRFINYGKDYVAGGNNAVSASLGKVVFEEGVEEYYLVVKATAARFGNTDPNSTERHAQSTNITLRKLTLSTYVPPVPPNVDKMTYNFLYTQQSGSIFGSSFLTEMNLLYDEMQQNWVPFSHNFGDSGKTGYADFCTVGSHKQAAKFEGLFSTPQVGEFLALKLLSPGTGLYNITLRYGQHVTGSQETNVYLIPASKVADANKDTIFALTMDDTYKLKIAPNFKSGYQVTDEKTRLIGQATLTAGESYIMVFKVIKDKSGTTDVSAYRGAYLLLKDLTLERTTRVATEEDYLEPEPEVPDFTGVADREAAAKVQAMIDAIGTITLNSKTQLATIRLAYNRLTDAQKALVTNYDKLVAAEKYFNEVMTTEDQKYADPVIALIKAIGSNITLESESAIVAARNAYDALTSGQAMLVTNYADLVAAEIALMELKGGPTPSTSLDAIAVAQIESIIDAIGEVTLKSANAIKGARNAYNNLTDSQKALVRNYNVLIAAEKKLAELQAAQKAQELTIWIVAGAGVALAAAVGTVFAIPATRTKILSLLRKLFRK